MGVGAATPGLGRPLTPLWLRLRPSAREASEEAAEGRARAREGSRRRPVRGLRGRGGAPRPHRVRGGGALNRRGFSSASPPHVGPFRRVGGEQNWEVGGAVGKQASGLFRRPWHAGVALLVPHGTWRQPALRARPPCRPPEGSFVGGAPSFFWAEGGGDAEWGRGGQEVGGRNGRGGGGGEDSQDVLRRPGGPPAQVTLAAGYGTLERHSSASLTWN